MNMICVQEIFYWFYDLLYDTILMLEFHKTTIFLALVVTLLSKMKFDQISKSNLYKFPPSPSSIPILGHVHHIYGDGKTAFEAIVKTLKQFKGQPFTVDLMNRKYVLLTSPHHSEIVLKTTAPKSDDYNTGEALMGQGLFTCRDMVLWKHNRRIIAPFFKTFKFISHYIPVYMEESRAVVDKIPVGRPVDILHILGRTTLTIICRTGIGVECTQQQCETFIEDMDCVMRACQQRIFQPWLMIDWVYRRSQLKIVHDAGIKGLRDFAWHMVEERRKIGQNGEKPQVQTFVDALLEEYNADEAEGARQILDEVITVLVGGQETTATELSFALVMLAMHPHVQEKVYQEVAQVLKDRPEKELIFDDLAQLQYLDCVINETLRLFPAVPLVSRELQETTDFGDYVLPKGLSVPIFIYETHRKPEVWKFPHKFYPEHFLPSEALKRPQFSYIPFASGVRYCIGQRYALLQMKAIISTIVRHFRIETTPGLSKMADIELEVNTTLKIFGGFHVVFHKRLLNDVVEKGLINGMKTE